MVQSVRKSTSCTHCIASMYIRLLLLFCSETADMEHCTVINLIENAWRFLKCSVIQIKKVISKTAM